MMKKCLVLLMVLSIASMATAGLVWSQSTLDLTGAGDSATIQLVSTDGVMAAGYVDALGLGGVASITSITPLGAAGDDAYATVYSAGHSYAGWSLVGMADLAPPFNNAPGAVFDVVIVALGDGSGTANSDYYGSFGAAGDILTVNVPEPITMGLLGLGGLFLRRRK